MIHLFAYGTLKPGAANHHICAPWGVAACSAIAHGSLYALPFGYPAMTIGPGWVRGTRLSFTVPAILDILDEFEQHDPDAFYQYRPNLVMAQHQYDRQRITIFTPDHQSLGLAWTYVMTTPQIERLGGVLLPDGVWPVARSTSDC